MAPVEDGRGAVAQLVQRADEVAQIDIAGAIARREVLVHVAVVVADSHPVRADAAQLVLPGMDVGVDHAGDDHMVRSVYHDRAGSGDASIDAGDPAVFHEKITPADVPQPGIHRHQRGVLDQR